MPTGLRLQADSAGMERKKVKSLLGLTGPLPNPTPPAPPQLSPSLSV